MEEKPGLGRSLLGGIGSLLGSEKALAALSLIIASTTLVILGHMSVDQWTSYTEVIFGGYIIGKTVQGGVSTWAEAKKPESSSTVTIKTEEKHADA